MAGETETFASADEPFRGIILVPFHRIAVVHGELMMKVVISLAHRQEGGNQMVARSIPVIIGRVSEPVGDGIDAECRLRARL